MLSHHADDGDNKRLVTGESTKEAVNHCAGKAGMLRLHLWFLPRAFFSHGGHGCGGHPAFPAPSLVEGRCERQNSGAVRRGDAEVCLPSLRASASADAIQTVIRGSDSGLLRFARNDRVRGLLLSPSCPAKAGHPVRRGVSAQALTSLEYWVARSRLRQGFDEAASSRARRSFSEGGKPGDDSGVRGCLTIKSETHRTAQANATPRVNPSPSPPTRSPCASRRPSRRRSPARTGASRRGRRNHGWRRDRG